MAEGATQRSASRPPLPLRSASVAHGAPSTRPASSPLKSLNQYRQLTESSHDASPRRLSDVRTRRRTPPDAGVHAGAPS